MRDILPDRIWENISGFGCNTPRYDDCAVWRQEQVVGDRRKARAAMVDPHWRWSRDQLFYSYFRAFQGGDRLVGTVDGLGDAASRLVASWQKPTSKIWLLGKVISKITDGSRQKFLRIAEYFVTLFAFLNCFNTLR